MSYNVQFVGLVCFLRESGGRHLLLPDGRDPGDGIEPHYALIAVAPDAVLRASGWDGDEAVTGGTFELPPCSVTIEGSDVPGSLDAREHDGLLPELRRLDPNFEIDPERAQTIATLHVRQGSLHAYVIPGGSAAISELRVPHDGTIRIRVTPRDGSRERSIELKPGTEIAVANIAKQPYLGGPEHNGHFRIYEKLSVHPVFLREPDALPAVLAESPSPHRIVSGPKPIGLTVSCSNTGCCTP
jgi:hypothetical protein